MNTKTVTLALLAATLSLTTAQDDGFTPLFDGKTLAGWHNINGAPSTWSVTADGLLHCDGKPISALRTLRHYENFILELEWRHLKPRGNAGVFVWAAPITATGQPFLRAVEVQVLENAFGNNASHTTHGDIFPIHGSTMKPFPPSRGQRSFPTEHLSKPSPQWNHYRITCNDGTIKLAVNGKQVSGGSGCSYRNGYIALESEGGVVDYRNIRIKELPSTGAAPADTAPLFSGHQSIYNGVDLTGWAPQKTWSTRDWNLVASKNATPLSTLASYTDIEVTCDFKLPEKITADPRPAPASSRLAIDPTTFPEARKGWNRAVVTVSGNHQSATLNGQPVAAYPPTPNTASGPLALVPLTTGNAFASIYIRPISE